MMKKICVINGPNLNMLGEREPEIYGREKLRDIILLLKREAKKRGVKIKAYQSNHEGRIIDKIQSLKRGNYIGLIINPGAYTHYSYSIRDAIKAVGVKTCEVHLSDIDNREAFRRKSVIRDVCIDQIKGLGPKGYLKAMEAILTD